MLSYLKPKRSHEHIAEKICRIIVYTIGWVEVCRENNILLRVIDDRIGIDETPLNTCRGKTHRREQHALGQRTVKFTELSLACIKPAHCGLKVLNHIVNA